LPYETVPYIIKAMAKPDSTGKSASDPVANPPPEPTAKADIDAARLSKSGVSKSGVSKSGISNRPREIGGPSGLEPTRYGDWERNGRVSDF